MADKKYPLPRQRSTGENIGLSQVSTGSIKLTNTKTFLAAVNRHSARFDPALNKSGAFANDYLRPSTTPSGRFNWTELTERLKAAEQEKKLRYELAKQKNLVKAGHFGELKNKQIFSLFFRRCHCLFTGNMFYRHPYRIVTFLEIVFPPLFAFIIFLAFTSGISWQKAYHERVTADAEKLHFHEIGMDVLETAFRDEVCDSNGRLLLVYTPDNNFTKWIMGRVLKNLKISHQNKLRTNQHDGFGYLGVESHAELIETCILHRRDKNLHKEPIGITFIYDPKQISVVTGAPNNVTFSISTFNPTISATSESHPYVEPPRSEDWQTPYIKSGFVGLQALIEWAYINYISELIVLQEIIEMNKTVDFNDLRSMKESREEVKAFVRDPLNFPERRLRLVFFPNFYNKTLRALIKTIVCIVLVLAYTSLSYFIVKQIVREHESGIKDLLKMHCLPIYVHWIVLGFHALLFRTITAILVTAAFFIDASGKGSLFQNSNYIIVFIFIWIHLLALTAFNFFLSTILTNVTLSGIYSISIGFLTYIVPLTLWKAGLINHIPNIIISFLFPNWALVNGISEIIEFECDGQGVDWINLIDFKLKLTNELSLSTVILILFGSCITYFTLAVLENLGQQKKLSTSVKWYQFIEKCHIIRHKQKLVASLPKSDDDDDNYEKPIIYEKFEKSHKSIVKIRNISKVYGRHKLVLDNISMNFGDGEITVILGHTSSGKTSIILCLAGMVTPTVGYATINGYNVITEIDKARQFMGLCPQELIVFNLLTVNEHLVLCYRLRGLKFEEANRQAGELLHMLRLYDVRNRKPAYLTNNEKRKLVIAMCLVDNPGVILLDEPTLGMDALARREIWDILKNLKKEGHTIILSTNMMDEAEYLADRIALLAHGKLICYGSPRFLKTQYDTGYILRIVPEIDKFNIDGLNKITEEYMGQKLTESKKKPMSDTNNILFELPKIKIAQFPNVFDEIEKNKEDLGITSYNIQQVSLCDIFIKICESSNCEGNSPDVYLRRNSNEGWGSNLAEEIPSIPAEENFKPKIWHHFLALFYKRWLCTRNRQKMMCLEYIFPLLLILATAWNSDVFVTPLPVSTPRTFKLEDFPKVRVYTRMASDAKDPDYIGWSIAVDKILGNYSDKLLPKDAIYTKIREDLKRDKRTTNFTLEKRMIALERRQMFSSPSRVGKSYFIGYYSSGSLHSPALVMNIIANILLLGVTSNRNDTYRINVINSPLPAILDKPFDEPCDISCIIYATIISFSCGMFLAALLPFPLAEQRNGMKQLQLMTGVHPITYWLSEYIFDIFISGILTTLIFFIFSLDINNSYNEPGVQFSLLLIVLFFLCWSGLPWVYYLSTIAHAKVGGYSFIMWLHVLLGILPTMVTEIWLYKDTTLGVIIVRWAFHIFPPYTFTLALYSWFHAVSVERTCRAIPKLISEMCSPSKEHTDLFLKNLQLQEIYKYVIANDINLGKCCPRICNQTNSCYVFPDLLSLEEGEKHNAGILGDLIALCLQGIVLWTFLIISEKRIFERLFQSIVYKFMANQEKRRHGDGQIPELLADIKKEKDRVSAIVSTGHIPDQIALICQDLTKSYATQMVINNVNMEVKKGECISFLGGGGSGKTSIMKMLSGEIIPTRGTVYIGNTNLHRSRKKYLSNIGYCPQTNCIFDDFTGIQMLELMGRLKGVPRSLLTVHIKKWLQILGLEEAGKDKCGTYSPSMKRRLCGAMALIGGNPIILLDEPTTGVDPLARQRFWSVIKYLTMKGHSVIFTSYNVEECTALSTRILVISEGNVQCVGTPHGLQRRFSRGFTLMLRLRYDSMTPIEIVSFSIGKITDLKNCVEKKFKHVTLRDEQDNLLLYFLRDTKLTWGDVFRKAEEIKKEFEQILEKYFISQSSLDDIFILLTNKYRELDKPRRMEPSGEVSNIDKEQAAIKAATKVLS